MLLEKENSLLCNLPDWIVIKPKHPNTGREFNIRHWESSNSEGANSLATALLLEPAYSSNTRTPEGASSSTVGRNARALGNSLNSKCVCI